MTRSTEDYTVAIICALSLELLAVRCMFDVQHPRLPLSPDSGDTNIYQYGELHGHNVVACSLPGQYGKGSAATVATNLERTFTSIRWRLMVGIGGGVPSTKHPISLGDVVVSMPRNGRAAVVQYDMGKATNHGFTLTGFLCPPPAHLRQAANAMDLDHDYNNNNRIAEHIAHLVAGYPHLAEYARPQSANVAQASSRIHYGVIASGDTVIKSKERREQLVKLCEELFCVETEAAGISTAYECIVIRGISDLADENKNDEWQRYAAAAAAAVAKEMLQQVTPAATVSTDAGLWPRALEDRNYDQEWGPHRDYYRVYQYGNGTQQTGSGNVSLSVNGNSVYE